MGVYSIAWYEDNKIPYTTYSRYNSILGKEIEIKRYEKDYALGRIDIHGVPDEPWGLEYGVSIMDQESWCKLGDYLRKLALTELPTKQELLKRFELDTGTKINWWLG